MGDGPSTTQIDFSKYATAAPPQIDFDKYVSAPPTGFNASAGENHPLVTPLPGEDFAATLARAANAGKTVTPQQIAASTAEAKKDVPTVLGTAALAGPA